MSVLFVLFRKVIIMTKKIQFVLFCFFSFLLNFSCFAMDIPNCNHSKTNYIIEKFSFDDSETPTDSKNCCYDCTENFMKTYLYDYIGTPFLVKHCGFYSRFKDGTTSINIINQLQGYICVDGSCRYHDNIIFIDDDVYRTFSLKWGPNYPPRAFCLREGHERKLFTITPINS